MTKKQKGKKKKAKVNDLIKILQTTDSLLSLESSEKGVLKTFIRELKDILNPYKSLSGNDFLNLLRNSLLTIDVKQTGILERYVDVQFGIESISLDELKTLLAKNALSKEQLLLVGEKRFGLSKGTLRRSKKEDIQGLIISAIQNIETLDVIERKATE
jgi:hypothetical protein